MSEKKSRIKPVSFIIMLLGLGISIWAVIEIMRSLLLSSTVKYVAVGALCAINLICLLIALFAKHKWPQVILSLLALLISGTGVFALTKVNSAIDYVNNVFTTMPETTNHSVYILANPDYLSNEEIDYRDIMVGMLEEYVTCDMAPVYQSIYDRGTSLDILTYETIPSIVSQYSFNSRGGYSRLGAMIMPDELIETISDSYPNGSILSSTTIKHQYTEEIPTDLPVASDKDITKDTFTVLIGGNDARGLKSDEDFMNRTDISILLTFNPTTHKLLVTVLPYDLEVTVDGKVDRLNYVSLYSINNWQTAVSELLDTPIDYYARVNYSSVAKLIDAIGGIEIENEQAFQSYQEVKTSEGWIKPQYYFDKGKLTLDGTQALVYAREFYHLNKGYESHWDIQKSIYKAIKNKLSETAFNISFESFSDVMDITKKYDSIVTNLKSIADSMNKSVATNIDAKEFIGYMIKSSLDPSALWSIEIQKLPALYNSVACYSTNNTEVFAGTVNPEALQTAIEKIHSLTKQ